MNAEWISATEAVQKVSAHLGCNMQSAADILIAYTRGRDVGVRYRSFTIDLHDRRYLPHSGELPLPETLSPQEWRQLLEEASTSNGFDWVSSQLSVVDQTVSFEGRTQIEKTHSTTVYGHIEFWLADLAPLALERKLVSGGRRTGAFWPKLAEETAMYLFNNGAPEEWGVSQAEAIETILRPLSGDKMVPPSTSTVQTLLVAISKRVHGTGRP